MVIGAKKCPFCKGEDLSMQDMSCIVGEGSFYIWCENKKCQAVGPEAGTPEKATKKWNRAKR